MEIEFKVNVVWVPFRIGIGYIFFPIINFEK